MAGGGNLNSGRLHSDYKAGLKAQREGVKGKYRVAFVRTFEGLTSLEIDMRMDYARSMIAEHIKCDIPAMINFRRHKLSEKVNLTSKDEMSYVKQGTKTIGKVNIRTQRGFKGYTLIVVYQEKYTPPTQSHLKLGSLTKMSPTEQKIKNRKARTKRK